MDNQSSLAVRKGKLLSMFIIAIIIAVMPFLFSFAQQPDPGGSTLIVLQGEGGFNLFGPTESLVFGLLGIVFWIWSKPEGQKLLAIWGWIKDHTKDTVGAFMAWGLVWLMWMGLIGYTGDIKWLEAFKDIFPNKIGPFAIPIAICSSSIVNHIVGHIEERAKRKAEGLI